jgi:hypothetical protein
VRCDACDPSRSWLAVWSSWSSGNLNGTVARSFAASLSCSTYSYARAPPSGSLPGGLQGPQCGTTRSGLGPAALLPASGDSPSRTGLAPARSLAGQYVHSEQPFRVGFKFELEARACQGARARVTSPATGRSPSGPGPRLGWS